MKLHSAAHIVYNFSNIVLDGLADTKLIGSNVDFTKYRVDYVMDGSIGEYLPKIQELSNEFISKGIYIVCKERDGQLGRRCWICEDIDFDCGGTHVKNTSEIGKLRLKRKNLGAGKERIEIMLKE
jgi:alanyl-tRNA synthetase